MDIAEQMFQTAKKLFTQLAEETPLAYFPYLAKNCIGLGVLYVNTNRIDKAEQEFLQVEYIYEQLDKVFPERYILDLQRARCRLKQLKDYM